MNSLVSCQVNFRNFINDLDSRKGSSQFKKFCFDLFLYKPFWMQNKVVQDQFHDYCYMRIWDDIHYYDIEMVFLP